MLDIFGLFSVNTLYVLIGITVLVIIAIVLSIISIAKSSKMKKIYNQFMEDGDGKSIESLIKSNLNDIDSLKAISGKNAVAVKDIYEKLQYTFQKIGIVKYDAFHEMGGKLSFALSMLDKNNNGYIVNMMHSNTGCFAYIKEIVNGKSFLDLGSEEEKALNQALAGRMGDTDLSKTINDKIQEDKI